jgi:hypothetical protein
VLRNWFHISRAIGFILTIAGLVLAVWFFQTAALPGPAPLPNFIVAAIAAAMIMVGVRYILKSNAMKPKPEAGKE